MTRYRAIRHASLHTVRLGLAVALVACHRSVGGGVPQVAPPPVASPPVAAAASVPTAGAGVTGGGQSPPSSAGRPTSARADSMRLSFRLADLTAFKGSAPTPALYTREVLFYAKQPIVTAAGVRSVAAAFSANGMPVLHIALCADAGNRLLAFTRANRRRRMVVMSNAEVLIAPTILGDVGAEIEIAGIGTAEQSITLKRAIDAVIGDAPCGGTR